MDEVRETGPWPSGSAANTPLLRKSHLSVAYGRPECRPTGLTGLTGLTGPPRLAFHGDGASHAAAALASASLQSHQRPAPPPCCPTGSASAFLTPSRLAPSSTKLQKDAGCCPLSIPLGVPRVFAVLPLQIVPSQALSGRV